MKLDVLIIDDEELFREDTAEMLRDRGYDVDTAPDGETGLEQVRESEPDIVLLDLIMPGMDGTEVLSAILDESPDTEVIIITAHGSLDTAVQTFREGAYDYILKPVDFDELFERLDRIKKERGMEAEVNELREELTRGSETFGMVGRSDEMEHVYERIEKVAPTDANVLIEGESGTGKELVARAIHNRRFPAGRRFVPVNCSALSKNLLESELFGHVEGAFTGATESKEGLFEAADGGTLFLDEIAEMPGELQSKLLRAIENSEISRVGSTETIEVEPRIIAASNQDVQQLVEEGEFRDDLYYRLNVMEIRIPPLRERKEDIPLFIEYFIDRYNDELNKNVEGVEEDVIQRLMMYSWPGNVRQLENMIERAVILRSEGQLRLEDFPPEIWEGNEDEESAKNLKEVVESFEKAYIKSVLEQTDGNRGEAAERLGIDRSTIYRKLESDED